MLLSNKKGHAVPFPEYDTLHAGKCSELASLRIEQVLVGLLMEEGCKYA